jgi:hypothetical protein
MAKPTLSPAPAAANLIRTTRAILSWAGAGVDRGGDQDRLPWSGNAEVLHEQQSAKREIAIGVRQRGQRLEGAGQREAHDTVRGPSQ